MYTFNISLCSFLRFCWKKDYYHCWWAVVRSRWNIAECSIFLVVSAFYDATMHECDMTSFLSFHI